jgi:hypothetical protein
MRIKCRIDSQNPGHTRFTVFQDGGNCGQLVMDTEAAKLFFNTMVEGVMWGGNMGFEIEIDNKENPDDKVDSPGWDRDS